MSNPTTPFSWQMPTSTDLVTDLPADFEVFGQAVATSMADLLGGTTGQILSKTTNADMDFTWITNDQGDITAVNTTAPLQGGATSGAVTLSVDAATTLAAGVVQLTNSTSSTSTTTAAVPANVKTAYDLAAAAIPTTTVTTAGDIIYRNATVPTRLGIGTANQVLRVNSGATAPEWATISSTPTYAGASLSNNGTVTVASNTWTAIPYPQEEWDTDGFHSTSTNNSRFTIPTGKAGKYLFTITLDYEGYNGWANSRISVYKNGSQLKYASQFANGTTGSGFGFTLSGIVDAVVGDYYETYAWQNTGVSRVYYPGVTNSNCTWAYLGA